MTKPTQTLTDVVIRFAGDSGDGMQLTGTQFTDTSAIHGNDLATFPDYPAEIRAPAGTLNGVSGFQLHFSSTDILTPGDSPSVLVAMNAAALKTNLHLLRAGAMIIVNTDKFAKRDLELALYESNPLEDGSLDDFQVVKVPLSSLSKASVEDTGLKAKEADRCKNFFALGMCYWLYSRDMKHTVDWINGKFKAPYSTANLKALEAGWSFVDTLEILSNNYEIPPAKLSSGVYRNITGNHALALGFVTAGHLSGLQLFQGAYPITPASDVLHYLSKYKSHNVLTFQAEDEIAAISASIGAAFGGSLAITTSSGPGIALKGEAIGLATITELPLVIVDIQRGGPSTGLPTKTEQSDLNIAVFGRHGESPIPVIAAGTASDCFDVAVEASKVAIEFRMPVMVLTDGYLANGSEPWKLPDIGTLPTITPAFEPARKDGTPFLPYERNKETLARPWAIPGTEGLTHRIGGLEKQDGTGNVSYDPANHEFMSHLRQAKVDKIQSVIPDVEVFGEEEGLLVVTWGSPFGAVRSAVSEELRAGSNIGHVHLRWLNPLPANLKQVLQTASKVVTAELNLGQLQRYLQGEFAIEMGSITKIQGQPYQIEELREHFAQHLQAMDEDSSSEA
jgi:2-oxoglutarate ferredoxin oxidoreductase subunit alpha